MIQHIHYLPFRKAKAQSNSPSPNASGGLRARRRLRWTRSPNKRALLIYWHKVLHPHSTRNSQYKAAVLFHEQCSSLKSKVYLLCSLTNMYSWISLSCCSASVSIPLLSGSILQTHKSNSFKILNTHERGWVGGFSENIWSYLIPKNPLLLQYVHETCSKMRLCTIIV